jgi:acyl-CoA thioester hydrolase
MKASDSATRAAVTVEVRYAETDQMGVVHHANYLVWFELARTRLCEGSGLHYSQVERLGHFLMVTGAELSYRKSARYGDTVEVSARIARLGSRGVRFVYEVRRGSELLATGSTDHIWIERASGSPCHTPEVLRAGFARLAGAGATD